MSEKTMFDTLAELFARDVDPTLVARALARTPTERIQWLEEMQALAEQARAEGAVPARRLHPDGVCIICGSALRKG